jgi:two-component system, LuxR family, sensor kinase FixL
MASGVLRTALNRLRGHTKAMFSKAAQALMDAAIDAIVVIDHRGIIVAVNEGTRSMFGYRTDELLGENVRMLMPEPDRGAHDGHLRAYLSSGVAHVIGKGRDVVAMRKSGACFPAHLSVGRIPDTAPPRFVGFVRDNSASVEREEQARLANDRLTSVSRLATLGEMAAGIAHELNQPLTAINAYARASERFITMPIPDLGELRDAVREISAEALRAGDIIRRMRQLVRKDPGEQTAVEARALIEDLRVLISADARIHGAHVHYRLGSDGVKITADGVQLQQLILNLVRNALEALATQAPGSRDVEIATQLVDGQVEISVSDNGPGVLPAIEHRMFEPFCTTKPGGTGLGLAISRTIAQAHGGSVGYRPVLPHGTCFYVRLPALQGVTS